MKLVKKAFSIFTASNGDVIVNADTASANTLFATAGVSNDIYGSSQRDLIRGGTGSDHLFGFAGNDSISGGAGNDLVDGGQGNDYLEGGAGDDVLTGGSGNDVFVFQINNTNARVNFSRDIGNDTVTDFKSGEDHIDLSSIFARFSDADVGTIIDALTSVQTYEAGDHNVGGLNPKNYKNGIATDGSFYGLNGDLYKFKVTADMDFSDNQSVTLWIKNYNDLTDKGATITLKNLDGLVATDFVRETVKIAHGTASSDTLDYSALAGLKGIKAYGQAGNDIMTGTANDDTLYGDAGKDTLHGGNGSDNLYGGSDGDTLYGDAGDDYLYGGVNGATYAGSTSRDTLTGGTGHDTFIFGGSVVTDSAGNPSFVFDKGATVVTDFRLGEDHVRFADTTNFSGDMTWASLDYSVEESTLRGLLSKQDGDLQLRDGNSVYLLKDIFSASSGLQDVNHDGKLDMNDLNSSQLHSIFTF